MFYILNNPFIMFALICIFAIILSTALIFFIVIKPLKKRFDMQSDLLYILMKKTSLYNDQLLTVIDDNNVTKENITSLSTSLESFMEDARKKESIKIYPNPQMVEMIESTINEQIGIEIVLTQHLTLKPKEMLTTIVTNTRKTYPMVDDEYISKKCIAMVEAMRQNNGSKENK